jgi:hypothetical protein
MVSKIIENQSTLGFVVFGTDLGAADPTAEAEQIPFSGLTKG